MGAPDQVELVVPRVDVEHRADSCDVVLVAVCIFDVLVADGHLGEQSEAPGRALAQFLCGVEAVHQQRPSPGPLVFETVKNLNAAAGPGVRIRVRTIVVTPLREDGGVRRCKIVGENVFFGKKRH